MFALDFLYLYKYKIGSFIIVSLDNKLEEFL